MRTHASPKWKLIVIAYAAVIVFFGGVIMAKSQEQTSAPVPAEDEYCLALENELQRTVDQGLTIEPLKSWSFSWIYQQIEEAFGSPVRGGLVIGGLIVRNPAIQEKVLIAFVDENGMVCNRVVLETAVYMSMLGREA